MTDYVRGVIIGWLSVLGVILGLCLLVIEMNQLVKRRRQIVTKNEAKQAKNKNNHYSKQDFTHTHIVSKSKRENNPD